MKTYFVSNYYALLPHFCGVRRVMRMLVVPPGLPNVSGLTCKQKVTSTWRLWEPEWGGRGSVEEEYPEGGGGGDGI